MASLAFAAKPAFAARQSAARPAVSRRALVIRSAKGGEEGGKTWDKSVYGRVGSSGNYNLLASSIAKVGGWGWWVWAHRAARACAGRPAPPPSLQHLPAHTPSPPAALLQVGLDGELMGAGPFTLFAPGEW